MKRWFFLLLCCVLCLANAKTGSCGELPELPEQYIKDGYTVCGYFRAMDGNIFSFDFIPKSNSYRIQNYYVYHYGSNLDCGVAYRRF